MVNITSIDSPASSPEHERHFPNDKKMSNAVFNALDVRHLHVASLSSYSSGLNIIYCVYN